LILTSDAADDETEFVIPAVLRAVDTDKLRLWKNYRGMWADRKRSDALVLTDDFTYNSLTGTITLLEGLSEGDALYAEVWHDLTNPPQLLKDFALEMAVRAIMKAIPTLVDEERARQIENDRASTDQRMRDLMRGELRIAEWDDLEFIAERETISDYGFGTVDPTVAW
jgi:hypothetical protein